MLLKMKITLFLLLVFKLIYASDKDEAFKKAIDYCNCKIAYTYCKQYSEMKPNSSKSKSFELIKDDLKCIIGQSKPFKSINETLKKNDFGSFSKKSTKVIAEILKKEIETSNTDQVVSIIISGIYESSEFEGFFAQYSEVGALKESLTKELKEFLNPYFSSVVSAIKENSVNDVAQTTNDFEREIARLEKKLEDSKYRPFSFNWTSIILIFLICGFVFFLLMYNMTKLEHKVKRHREEFKELQQNRAFNNSNQSNNLNTYSKDFKNSVERNISDINIEITSLQRLYSELSEKLQSNSNNLSSITIPDIQAEKQLVEILYAPIPNRDGSFSAANVTSIENQSSSFYKFTIVDNLSQRASFEFLNVERAIKDATSRPEMILNPVCKVRNALNQNSRRIKTIEPGIVIKQNDKWILDKSAVVEYE